MQIMKLNASQRDQAGKSGARRLRSSGKIPAVAYGRGVPTKSLSVSPHELELVLKSERGRNTVVELAVEGSDKLTVLLREFQHHPITRQLLHADFVQIALDQAVTVDVPLELTGKAAGVVLGGTLRQVFRKLPVRCLPEQIPVKIVHDVTSLGLDQHVATKDLALPEGVSVLLPPEQTLVAIVHEKAPPEEEAAPAAGAAGAGGAAPGTGTGKSMAPGKAEAASAEKK
jgi:large subunit ribosomal protein L25